MTAYYANVIKVNGNAGRGSVRAVSASRGPRKPLMTDVMSAFVRLASGIALKESARKFARTVTLDSGNVSSAFVWMGIGFVK